MSEGMNRVMLLGNLVEDPQVRQTGRTQVCNLRLATTERYQGKDKQWQERTEYHRIVLWGPRSVVEFLRKGTRVLVEGSLRTSSYDDRDGVKRYKTEVVATNIILCGGRPSAEPREDEPDASYGVDPPEDDDIPF